MTDLEFVRSRAKQIYDAASALAQKFGRQAWVNTNFHVEAATVMIVAFHYAEPGKSVPRLIMFSIDSQSPNEIKVREIEEKSNKLRVYSFGDEFIPDALYILSQALPVANA